MRLKEIVSKWYTSNDGTRLLSESVVVPEVELALKDWINSNTLKHFVLIGGVALSYHSIPRMTMDVDTLYLSRNDIPNIVDKFKRTRPGAFLHNQTHVEVEVLSSDSININPVLVQQVMDTAVDGGNIKIASRSGLVALKLEANRTGAKGLQDRADIVNLIGLGVDISPFTLTSNALELYDKLVIVSNE